MVGEEMASFLDLEFGDEGDEGKWNMEPKDEGVLELEDDIDSIDGLFHWQMSD